MDIIRYKLFADIVATGSFTKSGKNLALLIGEPIMDMWDVLSMFCLLVIGFALFVRTKQGVTLPR